MKITISMNDEILREADKTAHRIGLNRSRFFALAVGDFLQRQRQEQMLLRLNEVYAGEGEPAEKRLLRGIKAKARRTVKNSW
jgi:metal-responsive CopG/Arc/MetJ family transcriptional regulator